MENVSIYNVPIHLSHPIQELLQQTVDRKVRNMQSQSSSSSSSPPKRKPLTHPQTKMYNQELQFATLLQERISEIKISSQLLLTTLTHPNAQRQKNIPYHVFRSLDDLVKSIRKLIQWIVEENLHYHFVIHAQTQVKTYNNVLFREYLHALHSTKQELKLYINELERRVQQLEDSGFVPFVDYEVQLPLNMDLRISYHPQLILSRVDHRHLIAAKVTKELLKRRHNNTISTISNSFPTKANLQTLLSKQLFLYRYLRNNIAQLKHLHSEEKQKKKSLQTALIKGKQQGQSLKQQESIMQEQKWLTATDYFIYLKEIHRKMEKKLNNILWDRQKKVGRKGRSQSSNK